MLAIPDAQKLIDIRKVGRSFPKGSGADLGVLEKVDLTVKSGEIVGLLGRSGAGKSTLLHIIAGLIKPFSGAAECRGEATKGPPQGVAMLFQSFSLFERKKCGSSTRVNASTSGHRDCQYRKVNNNAARKKSQTPDIALFRGAK